MKPSKQAEVYYRRQLDQLINYMQGVVVAELQNDTLNDSNSLEFEGFKHGESAIINDALFSKGVELLSRQMTRILDRLESMNITNFATQMARGFTTRLNQNSSNAFNSNIKNSIGIDLNKVVSPPEVDDALSMAIRNNVALIKSIKDEYKDNVAKLIRDNVMNGERPSNIVTQIKDIGGVSKSRAKFIARDQTAKVNSDLVEIRAKSIGSDTYTWSGSLDERERPSHKVMEGKLCKWSDATVYSDDGGKTWKKRSAIGGVGLHVGRDYRCRCVAIVTVTW